MSDDVSLAQEVAALRKLSVPELQEKYREVWGKEPRVKHSREFLFKRIAWRVQEIRLGGLSRIARDRLEAVIAEIKLPAAESRRSVAGKLAPPQSAKAEDLRVGTTLVREWRGRQVCLTVVERGFEIDGVVHGSLSAAAKALTGTHWNGKLFWGLVARKKP